jgi:hypothetical protein
MRGAQRPEGLPEGGAAHPSGGYRGVCTQGVRRVRRGVSRTGAQVSVRRTS